MPLTFVQADLYGNWSTNPFASISCRPLLPHGATSPCAGHLRCTPTRSLGDAHGEESRTAPRQRKHLGPKRGSIQLGQGAVAHRSRGWCISDCRTSQAIDWRPGPDSRQRRTGVVGLFRNGSAAASSWATSGCAASAKDRGSNQRGFGAIVSRKRCACVDNDDRQYRDDTQRAGHASAHALAAAPAQFWMTAKALRKTRA
jgi:hypothetical protein